MNPSPPPKPPVPDNSFEFELTDFASAREALDDVSIALAAEVARPVDPADWATRRRPRIATDRALAGATMDWLMQLPADLRPNRLSEQLPRLANQIADAWADPRRCLGAIDDLLSDQRGGRRGLPRELREEVVALRGHLAAGVA